MPLPALPGNDKADQCVLIPGCQISLMGVGSLMLAVPILAAKSYCSFIK